MTAEDTWEGKLTPEEIREPWKLAPEKIRDLWKCRGVTGEYHQCDASLKKERDRLLKLSEGEVMWRARLAIWEFDHLPPPANPLERKGIIRIKAETKGLGKQNLQEQENAAKKYDQIRKAAGILMAQNPHLKRATPNHLAVEIQEKHPGRWSSRTIRRALTPKK
jgi:hypothetical protein